MTRDQERIFLKVVIDLEFLANSSSEEVERDIFRSAIYDLTKLAQEEK